MTKESMDSFIRTLVEQTMLEITLRGRTSVGGNKSRGGVVVNPHKKSPSGPFAPPPMEPKKRPEDMKKASVPPPKKPIASGPKAANPSASDLMGILKQIETAQSLEDMDPGDKAVLEKAKDLISRVIKGKAVNTEQKPGVPAKKSTPDTSSSSKKKAFPWSLKKKEEKTDK